MIRLGFAFLRGLRRPRNNPQPTRLALEHLEERVTPSVNTLSLTLTGPGTVASGADGDYPPSLRTLLDMPTEK